MSPPAVLLPDRMAGCSENGLELMAARLEVEEEDCGFVCVSAVRDDEAAVSVVLAADEVDCAFEGTVDDA